MSKGISVKDYELVDHGPCYAQYFQGCGCAFTQFTVCVTGCGDNPGMAIDDALDALAQDGWDVEGLNERMLADEGYESWPDSPSVSEEDGDDESELGYYVSIRVR